MKKEIKIEKTELIKDNNPSEATYKIIVKSLPQVRREVLPLLTRIETLSLNKKELDDLRNILNNYKL